VGTSTPNLQAPNNTYESETEMETDMEEYINSTDSDSEMELDMIQELELEDSDIELTDYNSVSSTNNSPNSSLDTEPESIFDLFIPLILIVRNKLPWIKISITLFLILIRISLSLLDISILVDLVTYVDPQSIIDMSLEEYQVWFDSLEKPLPELPLIDTSFTPIFALFSKVRIRVLIKIFIINNIIKLFLSYIEFNTLIPTDTLLSILKSNYRSSDTESFSIMIPSIKDSQSSSSSTDIDLDDDLELAIIEDIKREFEKRIAELKQTSISKSRIISSWISSWSGSKFTLDDQLVESDSISSESSITPSDSPTVIKYPNSTTESVSSVSTEKDYGTVIRREKLIFNLDNLDPEEALRILNKELPNLPDEARSSILSILSQFPDIRNLTNEHICRLISQIEEEIKQPLDTISLRGSSISIKSEK
jgi:hypothetical protein